MVHPHTAESARQTVDNVLLELNSAPALSTGRSPKGASVLSLQAQRRQRLRRQLQLLQTRKRVVRALRLHPTLVLLLLWSTSALMTLNPLKLRLLLTISLRLGWMP